jgi:hypothetical protein
VRKKTHGRESSEPLVGVPPSLKGLMYTPILSNIYLDKLDKELESRGLRFVRYADDFDIFVKSEMVADRVMASVSHWLESKLRLKMSASKTKVVRPSKSVFLGFTFWKSVKGWECKPTDKAKEKLESNWSPRSLLLNFSHFFFVTFKKIYIFAK